MAKHTPIIRALIGPALWHALQGAPIDRALIIAGGQLIWCHPTPQRVTTTCVSTAALRAALNDEAIDSGWLPPHVVRWGTGTHGPWLVQFHPPAIRRIAVITRPEEAPVPYDLPFPPLVFAGRGTAYFVWALAEVTFSPKARVYHAPFPNVNQNGSICFGANKPPVAAPDAIQHAWEMFVTTPFNDHLVTQKSRSQGQDIREMLKHLGETGATTYPVTDLVPAWRDTIDSVITTHFDEGGRIR